MHLNLDQFNLLLSRKLTSDEREAWVDHILACDQCADRFRVLNELARQAQPATVTRKPLRYAMAAAAVIFMCLYPYLAKLPESHSTAPESAELFGLDTQGESYQLALLDEVKRINYRAAIDRWSQGTDLREILIWQQRVQRP